MTYTSISIVFDCCDFSFLFFFLPFLTLVAIGSFVFQVSAQTGARVIGLETDARMHDLSVKMRERFVKAIPEDSGVKSMTDSTRLNELLVTRRIILIRSFRSKLFLSEFVSLSFSLLTVS